MKKCRFFMSLYKERDWLEEMARQGWLLTDITLGILYHFKECEPSEKVYEVDRFTQLGRPNKQQLTARKTALDIAKQYGWEVVTHDEDMNYYFVKDRAGDESDEFYEEDSLRRERAEKFRHHLSYEQPVLLLGMLLGITVLYALLFWLIEFSSANMTGLISVYLVCTAIIVLVSYSSIIFGEKIYQELCMSREEWEQGKRYAVKKSFSGTGQLLDFLREQNEKGLALTDYCNGIYSFEETEQRYQYETDTKSLLKKRLRARGKKYRAEKKDWNMQSLQWYEMSIAEAAKLGLEPVCVADNDILILKRKADEQGSLLNPGEESRMGRFWSFLNKALPWVVIFCIGAILGFVSARLRDM